MIYKCQVCRVEADHLSPEDAVQLITCGADNDAMLPEDESLHDSYMQNVLRVARGTYYILNGERVDVPQFG